MELKLVSFDTAKLAKEAGFNLQTVDYWKKEHSNNKAYLTTGVDYDSDRKVKWDWNFGGGSGILAPYPNKQYKEQYSAPTLVLLQKWLEEKNLYIRKNITINSKDKVVFNYQHCNLTLDTHWFTSPIEKDSWDEALEEGIVRALKFLIDEK